MRFASQRLRLFLAVFLSMAAATALPARQSVSASQADSSQARNHIAVPHRRLSADPEADGHIIFEENGQTTCRAATVEEARALMRAEPFVTLREISPARLQGITPLDDAGLRIVLRGTNQLETFPQAKAAFLRAAAAWEERIQTPITIIIDVDFGPQRFGQTFGDNVLGSTTSQVLFGDSIYSAVRADLIAGASSDQEAALYNSLPLTLVPTDIGDTNSMRSPSSVLRALGQIAAVAAPDQEPNFGNPPAIGFNSKFEFDFDPNDGIDFGKIDFDAVAAHEIGHALGFSTSTGLRELSPNAPIAPTVWDLFRFGSGATLSAFSTAQRKLSSGSDLSFYIGITDLLLSTGRPDGQGGDGRQPSHWKDDSLTGELIGVMDPTLPSGARQLISPNDLAALDLIGYRLKAKAGNSPPAFSAFAANLRSNSLTLTGNATDAEGDIAFAETKLFDSDGRLLAGSGQFPVNFAGLTAFNLAVPPNNLIVFPSATRVSLTLIDARGNRSISATADFGQADAGGPVISKASLSGTALTIKGPEFTGELQLEVNGVVVAPPRRIKVKSKGKKLKIGGSAEQLNLHPGLNRVIVFSDGRRSNIAVVSM